jgi:hypothetical protein
MKNSKRNAAGIALVLVLSFLAAARERKPRLQLTDDDRKAIVESVFADGFEELNAVTSEPNILNNCPTLTLHNEAVAFISTKNIEGRFVPKIAGIHFEFMTPDEIKKEVTTTDRHCFFEFTRFAVTGSKVMVDFGKFLKRPVYIYGESFRYEFTKVSGKWQPKYLARAVIES